MTQTDLSSRKASRRRVTLEDVARAAGISKATASLALNGRECIAPDTRRLVREAAERLGYEANVLAQNWSRGGCLTTIPILLSGLDLGVRTQKLQHIQAEIARRGYDVPVYVYGIPGKGDSSDPTALVSTIRRQRPRALLCNIESELRPETMAELNRYRDEGGTLLCYDYAVPLECDQVLFDREDNTYRATCHLQEHGHREIGFCFHGDPTPVNPRLNGFRRALRESGAEYRPDWTFFERGYEAAGARLAERFLALPAGDRPTALCIVNDAVASAFINQVRNAGLNVPGDVSVVGHDDSRAAAYCAVPLSSARHPVDEIAEAVVSLLFERVEGDSSGPRRVALQGTVTARASVAPPRAAA